MAIRGRASIADGEGVVGHLRGVDAHDPHHPLALVQLSSGVRVKVPFDILEHHDDGGYTMSARWSDFARVTDDGASIPVLAEQVKITVRPAPARQLRVRRRVVTEPHAVEVPHWRERITVERVLIDQLVDVAPPPRQDGDTLIIPCVEEVIVTETRLRVREELRIRVVREQATHRETVSLRRHELDLDSTRAVPSPEDQGDDL